MNKFSKNRIPMDWTKKPFVFFLTVLLLFSFSVYSQEIENISIPDKLVSYLSKRVQQNDLIVFDIDDTLLVAKDKILRADLIDSLINDLQDHFNFDKLSAVAFIQYCLELDNKRLGNGEIISPSFRTLIKESLDKLAKVIALTNVDSGSEATFINNLGIDYQPKIKGEDRRFEDLEKIGINFETSFKDELGSNSLELPVPICTNSDKKNPLFKKGILLSCHYSKGEILALFLDKITWKPSRIILVDNSLDNIISVKQKMENIGMPYIVIHFDYVEKYLSNLDRNAYEDQLDFLIKNKKWRSNDGY